MLQLSHYAAMHLLFLGHVKSNFEMNQNFLSKYELLTKFGKQANKYLKDVQKLWIGRFFDAHPLSTSTWGTGTWVSDNYLFWGRTQKFFATLPAIWSCKHKGQNSSFDSDMPMFLRFANAALVCLNRLMSNKRVVEDMDDVVKIYLDTMVEMDKWIMSCGTNDNEHISDNPEESATVGNTTNPRPRKKRRKKKGEPNFVKPNSLGLLSAVWSHWYLGPAILHWEGSWFGERKIQPAKGEMGVKRSTADWQHIVLQKLWCVETIAHLLEDGEENGSSQKRRDMDGVIRVYAKKTDVLEELANCKPISAVLDKNGCTWIAYRPTVEQLENDTT